MSGGYFDYTEYNISRIKDQIEHLIASNHDGTPDPYGGTVGRFYSPEVISKMKLAVSLLKDAYHATHHIDYLLSGDTGEEIFLERWVEDINPDRYLSR